MKAAFAPPAPLARPRRLRPARQRGNALLISMLMLLMVLLLAVAAMRSATLESRIATQRLESQRLNEAADGTLREGERLLTAHGVALKPCEANATTPVSTTGIPCFVSDVRVGTLGLGTDFTSNKAPASGFDAPHAYWYPRHITSTCPKSQSATSALDVATTGCTEFYEVNAQATQQEQAQSCGPDALCLRSSVNMFIK